MRKWMLRCLCFFLMFSLVACQRAKDVIDDQDDRNEVISTSASGENYYPILSSPAKNPSRETFYTSVSNFDFKSIGRGLQLYCLDYFSKDDYYLQEGQYLNNDRLREVLRRNPELYPYSIQPERGSVIEGYEDAIMVTSVFEQNFLQRDNGEYTIKGAAFSIVIDPQDAFGKEVEMQDETVYAFGKEAAQKLYTYLKTLDQLQDVPILIMVYQSSTEKQIYGGHYIAKVYCQDSFGDYQSVDDRYVIFTSSEAENYDPTTYTEFVQFKQHLKDFSQYEALGAVGYVHYRNGSLESMVIHVRCNVKTYTELVTFLNVIASDLNDRFSKTFDIRVKVESQDDFEAVVIKRSHEKARIELFY